MSKVKIISFIGLLSFSVSYSEGTEREIARCIDVKPLINNFDENKKSFERHSQELIKSLEKVSGDEAFFAKGRLESNLILVNVLEQLSDCFDNCLNRSVKSTKNQSVMDAIRYLKNEFPYAGAMQKVILKFLKDKFNVDSIQVLEQKIAAVTAV